MSKIEKQFVPPPHRSRWPAIGAAGVIAAAGYAVVGGLPGVALATAVVSAVGIWIGIDHIGRGLVAGRRSVADLIIETGLSPQRIYEWWHQTDDKPSARRLLSFDPSLLDDLSLYVLSRLARIAILWTRADRT